MVGKVLGVKGWQNKSDVRQDPLNHHQALVCLICTVKKRVLACMFKYSTPGRVYGCYS